MPEKNHCNYEILFSKKIMYLLPKLYFENYFKISIREPYHGSKEGLPQGASLHRTHSRCTEFHRSPLHTWRLTVQSRCVCKNEIHTLTIIIVNSKYYFKAINLTVQNTIRREKTTATLVYFWIQNFSLANSCLVGDIAHCTKAKL